jgi:hypothetical protein
MKENNSLQVGSEVLFKGQWMIVDEIDGDNLFLVDQDGGDHVVTFGSVDPL